MNIRIECPCGARYSFEVEPGEGRLPHPVQCPACQADGTGAANQIIAENQPPFPAPPPEGDAPPPADVFCARHPANLAVNYCFICRKPVCAACMASFGYLCSIGCRYEAERTKTKVPVFKGQKRVAEDRALRRGLWLTGAVVALAFLALASWGWFAFYGSKPHLTAWMKTPQPGPAAGQFLGRDKILVVTHAQASLLDLSLKKAFWTTRFDDAPAGSASPSIPSVFTNQGTVWICLGDRVKCLDAATGTVKQTIPVPGRFLSFTPGDSSLLVVSATDETDRTALHVALPDGLVSTQEISVPRKEKQTLPDDLPPNVQPTAAVLVSQALDEQKFNKPLDAMSSEFFSAGENLVELRVKLLEPRVNYVQSIKPRGPSQLNGQTTASTSSSLVAAEIFNDLKRSQTGGVRRVDESLYQVRLRRWTGPEPVEWTGELTGAPSFFPLATVDLLVAGNLLTVFDKQNHKLFDSKLTHPVSERFTTGDFARRLLPAAERAGALYFFDQGVLTAFSLPDGAVRWRLPSFGISGIQFDDQGMLYVNSTAAGPEDIQYADTITFEKIPNVLLKVDPAGGKILWKAPDRGERAFLSEKFLYAESVEKGGVGMANALAEALNTPQNNAGVTFHLYRLDPATGETLWSLFDTRRPDSISVQDNHLLLLFGDDLELFRYLTL